MARFPYMQWYPEDWIKDTRHLSLAAKGAWIDILNLMWINEQKRGQYSATEPALARAIGCSEAEIKMILEELKTVGELEFSGGTVTIMSRRIMREENERKYDRDRKQAQRCPKIVPDLSQNCPPEHIPEARSQKPEAREKKTDLPGLPPGAFELIWAKYPRKEGRIHAEKHFRQTVKSIQDWLDIQNALDNFLRKLRQEGTEAKYIPHGKTWFFNWRDYVTYSGVEMPRPPAPVVRPKVVEPPPPELTDQDLLEMHEQTVRTLKKCPQGPRCETCAEIRESRTVVDGALKKAMTRKTIANVR